MDISSAAATIVRALANYLSDHPQASDTEDGIAQWWLIEPTDSNHLQEALEWMVLNRWIEECSAADGRKRYRLVVKVELLHTLLSMLNPQDL